MERTHVLSHWHYYFDGLEHSPKEFLASVDAALAKRVIPDSAVERIELAEGAVLSGKREYVRVTRQGRSFDIGAGPFGSGFFVSWRFVRASRVKLRHLLVSLGVLIGSCVLLVWLLDGLGLLLWFAAIPVVPVVLGALVARGVLDVEEQVLEAPIVGWVYSVIFQPESYHRRDMAAAFESVVGRAVLEAVDALTDAKGIRALSEAERKPVHGGLARR